MPISPRSSETQWAAVPGVKVARRCLVLLEWRKPLPAPVAQLDRVAVFETVGCGFESRQARLHPAASSCAGAAAQALLQRRNASAGESVASSKICRTAGRAYMA